MSSLCLADVRVWKVCFKLSLTDAELAGHRDYYRVGILPNAHRFFLCPKNFDKYGSNVSHTNLPNIYLAQHAKT